MRLVFPFKNMATNALQGFLGKEEVKDFILIKKGEYDQQNLFGDNFFEYNVKHFKDSLPNFENEILQIINTTNQETIDSYFTELLENVIDIREMFAPDNIKLNIQKWNSEELESFEEQIEKDAEQYFASEDRKRKHLEEYEIEDFRGYRYWALNLPFSHSEKKTTLTNYNFFCVENQPDLIDETYTEAYNIFLNDLAQEYLDIAGKYGIPYSNGQIKSKVEHSIFYKPVVFVEGDLDITYIIKAAALLNQSELLDKVELRQRGGWANLDKIWAFYKDNNWETISQKKLLLYDCDIEKQDDEVGNVFRRIIKLIPENIISKGIENLFPNTLVYKAIEERKEFIDITRTFRVKRGESFEETIHIVNKDEKKNFCDWVCKNATIDDFANFQTIFDLIRIVI